MSKILNASIGRPSPANASRRCLLTMSSDDVDDVLTALGFDDEDDLPPSDFDEDDDAELD